MGWDKENLIASMDDLLKHCDAKDVDELAYIVTDELDVEAFVFEEDEGWVLVLSCDSGGLASFSNSR